MKIGKNPTIFFRLLYFFLFVAASILLYASLDGSENETIESRVSTKLEPNQFGFFSDSLDHKVFTVQNNQTLSEIFEDYHLPNTDINEIARKSKDIFSVRKIRSGKTYHIFHTSDSINTLKYFVYQKNPVDYVVFDLADSINIYNAEKEVTKLRNTKTAEIKTSLYEALIENNASIELAIKMSQVFAWQVDFYHLQKEITLKLFTKKNMLIDSKICGNRKNSWSLFL